MKALLLLLLVGQDLDLQDLQSGDATTRMAAAAAAHKAGAAGVAVAGKLLGHENRGVAKAASRALWTIANHARAERPAVNRALVALLQTPAARETALRILSVTADDAETVAAIAKLLPDPLALFALERIPHPSAGKVLIAALPHDGVIQALGARRATAAVPALIELAPKSALAVAALARIGDPRAEAVILERATPQDQLRYADARGSGVQAIYTKLLGSKQAHVRAAAVRKTRSFDVVVRMLDDAAPSVRAVARHNLVARKDAPIERAMLGAPRRSTRMELLRVAVARKMPRVTDFVISAVMKREPVAVELAGSLIDERLEPALLRAAEAPSVRNAAWASYLRHADARRAGGEDKRAVAMYHRILKGSRSRPVLVRALRGVAAAGRPESLDAIAPLIAEYGAEVQSTQIAISARLPEKAAIRVLESVCRTGVSRSVRARAAGHLRKLGVDTSRFVKERGFLVDWHLSGGHPPPKGDWDGNPFGQSVDVSSGWRKHHTEDLDGVVDLVRIFKKNTNVVAYGYAEFEWASDDEAMLKIGSDDGVAVWLNGERVHSNPVYRGLSVDQDRVSVRLRKGTNRILVKVSQGGGGWEFCVRVCDAGGRPVALK